MGAAGCRFFFRLDAEQPAPKGGLFPWWFQTGTRSTSCATAVSAVIANITTCGERYGKREIGRGVGLLDSRDEGEARQRQRARQEFVNRGAAPAAHADSPGRGEQCGSVPVEPEQRPAERGRSETQWQQFTPAIERWERTIGRPAPAPTDDGKLSSRFVEWMMGLPDGHVCGVGPTRTAELKMLGNAVVPAQAHLALELLHHDT